MWFSISIFIIAIVGLALLFTLKARELRGISGQGLLSRIRQADKLFETGMFGAQERFSAKVRLSFRTAYLFCKDWLHIGIFFAHDRLTNLSHRLGEYLKKHGTGAAKNRGHASFYLRNMLAHKKDIEQKETIKK